MTDPLAPHLAIALRHASADRTVTRIPRLEIGTVSTSGGRAPCHYRAMICFILRGAKHVALHDQRLAYTSAHYLVSAIDLPLTGQILNDDDGGTYVAVSLDIDPALVTDVAAAMPQVQGDSALGIGLAVNPMTSALRDTLLRMLSLLDTPEDIPVLGPMVERELLYRLLQGPQGRLLRQIGQPEGTLSRIRRAVGWIRDHHDTPVRIDALCNASGMSRASLHRHFLAITGMSPIQYHKQLRLQEAHRLLRLGDRNATEVALAVGYESASQFNREYARHFGDAPMRDARRIRQAFNHPPKR